MDSAIGSLWQNRTHPGSYMIVTGTERDERNKRIYHRFYYLDDFKTILIIDDWSLDKIFKKVS